MERRRFAHLEPVHRDNSVKAINPLPAARRSHDVIDRAFLIDLRKSEKDLHSNITEAWQRETERP